MTTEHHAHGGMERRIVIAVRFSMTVQKELSRRMDNRQSQPPSMAWPAGGLEQSLKEWLMKARGRKHGMREDGP